MLSKVSTPSALSVNVNQCKLTRLTEPGDVGVTTRVPPRNDRLTEQ
jgi:hypothetical protein